MSDTYLDLVIADGATAFWQCDDLDTMLIDATQNGHTITLASQTGITQGVNWFESYSGLSVDGTQDAATFDPISIAGPCTVEFWLRPTLQATERNTGEGTYATIIAHPTGDTGLYLYQFPTMIGPIYVSLVSTYAGGRAITTTTPLVALVYYVVLTVDGDGVATLYVNTSAEGSYADYGLEPSPILSNFLADGASFSVPLRAPVVSEFAIYAGTVLSAEQRGAHYEFLINGGQSGQAASGAVDTSFQWRYRAGCSS